MRCKGITFGIILNALPYVMQIMKMMGNAADDHNNYYMIVMMDMATQYWRWLLEMMMMKVRS
jgi:hypothetical protein